MIRLVGKKLIIPRGDTGSFSIPTISSFTNTDIAVFTIIDAKTQTKIFQTNCVEENDILTISFTHLDTVNLPVGKYYWDIKYYKDPVFEDGILIDGIEVDSYYAAYTLPICEIRQTGDILLTSEDAPSTTLSPESFNILNTKVNEINAIKQSAKEDTEAWAIGKRNGIDVDSSDPAYHNNSKYYAEQAGINVDMEIEAIENAGANQITTINTKGIEQINTITAAGAAQLINVANAGTQQINVINNTRDTVLASIPSDYTTLSNTVQNLEAGSLSAFNATNGQIPKADGNGSWAWEDSIITNIISNTNPVIIAQPGQRYVCNEVETINIIPSSSGICDIIFQSGTTPAILIIPNTVKWPVWFNPNNLDINTTYELNILDGIYGVVAVWT